MPGKLNAGGGLDRSDPQRTSKRGEAYSRAEPQVQEPLQCRQKINVAWRDGAKRQKRKIWLLR